MKYTNLLGVQSCYNFLNSTIKISDYIEFLIRNNIKAAFYADENVMYGAFEFYDLCKKNKIKPIIGLKITIESSEIYLYSKNNKGYKNLIIASSLIQEKIDMNKEFGIADILELIDDNLFVVVKSESIKLIDSIISKVKEDNFFYGVDCVLNNNNNNNIIYVNSINYLYKNDFESYKALFALKNNNSFDNVDIKNNLYYIDNLELEKVIDIKIHNHNLERIINNVEDNVIEENTKHFLKYENAKKMPSDSYLRFICEQNLDEYIDNNKIDNKSIYKNRLSYELDTIFKMGFSDYFLIVFDLITKAKEMNILYGPGRGSAAGSLVSFLLNITKLDPIKWNLIFERFLNIERVTLPDIDLDFQDDRRDELLEYLFNKYGKYHFATISTFQTIGVKNALRDCARVLELPLNDVNEMTKYISNENMLDLEKALLENKTLSMYKVKYPKLFEISKLLIGLPRQSGTHAAGVVFCDLKINEVVPIKVGINGILQTQYPMNYLERIGLIKTDILGLRNLTILQDVLKLIHKDKNIKIDLYNIPLNDEATFKTLNEGNTSGIFQLESKGMTDLLVKMNVSSVNDIALTSALFRPGPQDNIKVFLDRKNGIEKNYIINEDLNDILESTNGIIIYQEQVLEILKKIAGFSYNKADLIRRAISKKNYDLIKQEASNFIECSKLRGYSEEASSELWNYIEKFASYGFNKSHAIAYSLISYWMAYLKTHFKSNFYCCLLNSVIRNEDKTRQYIEELKRDNFIITAPSLRKPYINYQSKGTIIYMPLSVIKYIGPEFLKRIKEVYKKDKLIFENPLLLLSNLQETTLNEQKYLALVYSGAFDKYNLSRKSLVKYKEEVFNLIKSYKQINDNKLILDLPIIKDNEEELLSYEKEYIGFYISSHPIIRIRKNIKNIKKLTILKMINSPNMDVNSVVYLENIITKVDKNNNEMAFISCSDETMTIEVTVFSSIYKSIKSKLEKGSYYIISIKTQLYKNKITYSIGNFIEKVK
ncbi:DNA polymerase III subunit alpha [Spiroplasma turonicum]|uniref:DNA polymerase III subunit alpha n=1 Tax=Spiroplasma turonicum TaxID=216946 RepID=A0A0K1P5F5_9MOLU|nr:DNA polymerase III subunit alpha [Spiroplasma turonicum]AKU79409.1 DNA polymerase III subunit alpha [Spiroplasma turonicum]ALX70430.1 DNA polymerase III subunit alpha [Spiroplasma turonicum]